MEYIEGKSLGGLMRRLWLGGASLDRQIAAHIIAEAGSPRRGSEAAPRLGCGRQPALCIQLMLSSS